MAQARSELSEVHQWSELRRHVHWCLLLPPVEVMRVLHSELWRNLNVFYLGLTPIIPSLQHELEVILEGIWMSSELTGENPQGFTGGEFASLEEKWAPKTIKTYSASIRGSKTQWTLNKFSKLKSLAWLMVCEIQWTNEPPQTTIFLVHAHA